MTTNYSPDVCRRLQDEFKALGLYRPMRTVRYEQGTELLYRVRPVVPGPGRDVRLRVEKFAGGGFAGQVYRVRLISASAGCRAQNVVDDADLKAGEAYAMKIMVPPSRFSLFFRNALYAAGFQGQFQLQTNHQAARAGALWQKFIRAAAALKFGDPMSVNNIHATFVDDKIGSCGELSDWVEGRTWRLEIDDRMDLLRMWRRGKIEDDGLVGSPEYRAKYRFMGDFVKLLHELGAYEFARQYEWSTCKSQPNCLKRAESGEDPCSGLTAVDFRAGLALLPFLPMSPGDFRLIASGLRRGSVVQFDRGDTSKLRGYLDANPGMRRLLPQAGLMLEELERCERIYRDSLPDITHNFPRLLYDKSLWHTIRQSMQSGWRVRKVVDDKGVEKLARSRLKTVLFFLTGLLPVLGGVLRRWWGNRAWRAHYRNTLFKAGYLGRAIRGRICETLIAWHRSGRISGRRALMLCRHPARAVFHFPLSTLPAGFHRFLTDKKIFAEKLHFWFIRPFKLYFTASMRTAWLLEMVSKGRQKDILSEEDADTIMSRIDEPYIQRYLVSLVVHLMTLPVTQIVSLSVAGYFYWSRPDMSQAERTAAAAGIFALFQVIPLSPGSLCRGLYTTGMAVRDRNFKDYKIALSLSYFKYVGYLAFPIQMTTRYPALARFMAAHWATDAVRLVPVFGERGALLEHWVFSLFYNWPLTIRRRMEKVSAMRSAIAARRIHLPAVALTAGGVLTTAHYFYGAYAGVQPSVSNLWYLRSLLPLVLPVAFVGGWAANRFAGGMPRDRRIAAAAATGIVSGILYSLAVFFIGSSQYAGITGLWVPMLWRCFALAIFSALAAVIAELRQVPE